MAWVILLISGILEAVWATALGRIDGWAKPLPIIVFGTALALSMGGLGLAMKSLPIGTAYAVWVGVGAALTVGYAMWSGAESVSIAKVALILGIVGCVVGLKLLH